MTKGLREKILAAAKELFVKKGYKNTTLPELSASLNIGKSTLYHYFESKEDIYKNAVEDEIRLYIGKVESIFNDETVPSATRILNYLQMKEKLHENFPVLAQSLVDFLRRTNPIYLKDIINTMIQKEEKILELVFGSLKSENPVFTPQLPVRFYPLTLFLYLNINLISRDLKSENEADPDFALITKALHKLFTLPQG